jgi:hypothetical protein
MQDMKAKERSQSNHNDITVGINVEAPINSAELIPYWEAGSRSTCQDILRLLREPKADYFLCNQ